MLLQVRLQVVPRGIVVNLADDDAGAADDLDSIAFAVNLAETRPLAQGLVVANLQDWDLVLDAQGLDESHVVGLVTVLGQDAADGITTLKSADGLVETAGKTIAMLGMLERLLDGALDRVTLGGDGGWGGSGRFSIRHVVFLSSYLHC